MTLQEISALNRALDGADIPGLPPLQGENLKCTTELAKASLVRRGFLKTPETVSEEGAMLLRRMQQYKAAAAHLRLNALHMGVLPGNRAVLLLQNPVYGHYGFGYTGDLAAQWDAALARYAFLADTPPDAAFAPAVLSERAFARQYAPAQRKQLRVTRHEKGRLVADETVFAWRGTLYCYDRLARTLASRPAEELLKNWKKGLVVHCDNQL